MPFHIPHRKSENSDNCREGPIQDHPTHSSTTTTLSPPPPFSLSLYQPHQSASHASNIPNMPPPHNFRNFRTWNSSNYPFTSFRSNVIIPGIFSDHFTAYNLCLRHTVWPSLLSLLLQLSSCDTYSHVYYLFSCTIISVLGESGLCFIDCCNPSTWYSRNLNIYI